MPLNPESRILNPVLAWLLLCAALVIIMIAVGGYTRLSGSGLSITEWKPIHGIIPPLNEEQWLEEFDDYRATPQYAKVNKGMTLDEFKAIYWPEFLHRLLGRIIGAVFFFPWLFFVVRGQLPGKRKWRLFGIFALGGLQGFIGWFMVASGLIDSPYVSPIRLALHLSMAFLILGLLVWFIQDVRCQVSGVRKENNPSVTYLLWFALLCTQIILGALLAGMHGGLIYNTWPDMNGALIPPAPDAIALIQFAHRWLAALVTGGFIFWWFIHREYVKNTGLGKVCFWVTLIIAFQFVLGVLTLVNAVPLPLALAHQTTGVLLFVLGVVLMYKTCHPALVAGSGKN